MSDSFNHLTQPFRMAGQLDNGYLNRQFRCFNSPVTQPPNNPNDPKLPSWASGPVSPETKKRNNRMLLWVIAGLIALLVVVTAVGALFEDDSDSDADSRADVTPTNSTFYPSTRTTTLAPAPPAARSTITGPARVPCEAAPDAYVAVIEASLTDSSLSLANLQSLTAPGGLLYIGADIMRGAERESSQDTWVVEDDVVMALSSSANEFTILPDGRDLLDVTVSAGDEYGSALQNCVARVRQGG